MSSTSVRNSGRAEVAHWLRYAQQARVAHAQDVADHASALRRRRPTGCALRASPSRSAPGRVPRAGSLPAGAAPGGVIRRPRRASRTPGRPRARARPPACRSFRPCRRRRARCARSRPRSRGAGPCVHAIDAAVDQRLAAAARPRPAAPHAVASQYGSVKSTWITGVLGALEEGRLAAVRVVDDLVRQREHARAEVGADAADGARPRRRPRPSAPSAPRCSRGS